MSKQNGFTLLDALTTVTVLGLVLTVGLPSMSSLIRGNRIVSDTNGFVAAINTARAEALKSVVQVTICKSRDQTGCDDDASWHDGWIVFVDNDEDGNRDLAVTPEMLIGVHAGLEGQNTLWSAAFVDWIAFRPNGLVIGSGGNAGTFSLCSAAGPSYGRDISISRIGATSVDDNANGACP